MNKNIEGTMRIHFAGKERDFKLTFRNLASIEERLQKPVMQIVNGFTAGNGGKYTYEAVGDMVLKHGFSNCLSIVSDILLKSMGLDQENEQKLPLESNENETEKD